MVRGDRRNCTEEQAKYSSTKFTFVRETDPDLFGSAGSGARAARSVSLSCAASRSGLRENGWCHPAAAWSRYQTTPRAGRILPAGYLLGTFWGSLRSAVRISRLFSPATRKNVLSP